MDETMLSSHQHWTLPESIEWKAAPSSLPAGCLYAVLEGDPSQSGIFTARFRLVAGTRLAPHYHPKEERATLLSGKLRLGLGTTVNEATMVEVPAQSFLLVPPGEWHYAIFDKETEIQLTGDGPWAVIYHDGTRAQV